jgi:hypothetical protein
MTIDDILTLEPTASAEPTGLGINDIRRRWLDRQPISEEEEALLVLSIRRGYMAAPQAKLDGPKTKRAASPTKAAKPVAALDDLLAGI